MFKRKEIIIITSQKYIDSVLKEETAECIYGGPGFWSYALPIVAAVLVYMQVVAWG